MYLTVAVQLITENDFCTVFNLASNCGPVQCYDTMLT